MNFYVRTLSCVALLGMALMAVSQYRPGWAARRGLDWWGLPEQQDRLRGAERESAEIDARRDDALARIRARAGVIDELLAGRLTLVEAAARFRALNATALTLHGQPLPFYFAGATEEERVCRQVIQWAESTASNDLGRIDEETRRRLEAELVDLLAKNNGVLRLPQ